MALFQDRREAAYELARLLSYLRADQPIVLGLANGGVPVAEIIARSLDAPLDVLLIERLGAPKAPDRIVGAVDEHGRISMIRSSARWHHLSSRDMVAPAREAFRRLQRERGRIRRVLPEIDVRDRTVIIVCQGVATGAKMLGAIASVRDRGARKVIAAAPAGAGEAAWQLQESADTVVIPHRPSKFTDVAHFYRDFTPVNEDLVATIVEQWVAARPAPPPGVQTFVLRVTNDKGHLLSCEIDVPPGTKRGDGPFPTAIFVHNLGSDGRNPRTLPVSRRLAKRGIMGVRLDLTGHGRSEGDPSAATPERMAGDLCATLEAVSRVDEIDETRLALLGAGSGANLVMDAAGHTPGVRAVVARGPMCGGELERLARVGPPTLLVAADLDPVFRADKDDFRGTIPDRHQLYEIPDAVRQFDDAISRELMIGASVEWVADQLTAPIRDEAGPATAPVIETDVRADAPGAPKATT